MPLDLNRLFFRVALKPKTDLKRGYSYSMGMFGDESEAHAGLSSYAVQYSGVEGALESLNNRMGLVGEGYFVVLDGVHVGTGPDMEDLCRPQSIVFQKKLSKIRSFDSLLADLARVGITD
jgi:hypothetical protein